ncbi:hypothetical protein V1517DRAFT_195645 [Lipomyces orientalis]|uniref:Uncharacterized protein n=1 Tax=Lipomyces orientalis TaxID=1233043 RepID=A0ACC3TJB0_9ASCO
MNTVSHHYLESAYEPVQTTTKWYSNLKEKCCQSDQVTKSRTREEYRAAIRSLTKSPKDFEAWINQCEHAISHAEQKGVADASDTHAWFEDISVALKDMDHRLRDLAGNRDTRGNPSHSEPLQMTFVRK